MIGFWCGFNIPENYIILLSSGKILKSIYMYFLFNILATSLNSNLILFANVKITEAYLLNIMATSAYLFLPSSEIACATCNMILLLP